MGPKLLPELLSRPATVCAESISARGRERTWRPGHSGGSEHVAPSIASHRESRLLTLKRSDHFILCYVTDRRGLETAAGDHPETALMHCVEEAAHAGVDWIQIREKDLSARHLADLTRGAIRASDSALRSGRTRIFVNDRCDVAWAADAAGVHAGENSLPVSALIVAARASGRDFLVGASCHSLEQAIAAMREGADYLFFGPVFATPSKAQFGASQGLEKLADVCAAVSVPVIAIGGITVENARACRESGAAGIAAIRLFQKCGNVREVVAALAAACSG